MTVDPLISLITGAFGAALLGLLGAWIQTRREHARWVREQRFEAYDALMRLAERVRPIPDSTTDSAEEDEFANRLFETLGSVRLVGPEHIHDAARAFGEAATVYASLKPPTDDEGRARRKEAVDGLSNARKRLIELMRKELGMERGSRR